MSLTLVPGRIASRAPLPPHAAAEDTSIYISPQTLLAHAKNVTAEYTCPWGSCPATLHSFLTFEKHMEMHCLRVSKHRDICCLCEPCEGGPPFADLLALRQHVWDAHLSKYTFGCLKLRCIEEFTVTKVDMYANHVQFDHPEIWEKGIPFPYNGLEGFQQPICHPPQQQPPPDQLPPVVDPLIWTPISVLPYMAPEVVVMDVGPGQPIIPSPLSSTSPPPSAVTFASSSKRSASSCPTTPPSSDSEEEEKVKHQTDKSDKRYRPSAQRKLEFQDLKGFVCVPRAPNSHLPPDTLKFQPVRRHQNYEWARLGYPPLSAPQRPHSSESQQSRMHDGKFARLQTTVGYELMKKRTWAKMEQRGVLPPIPDTPQEQQKVLLDASNSPTMRMRAL